MRRHLAHSLITVLSAAAIGACWAIVVSTGGVMPDVTPDNTIATVLCLGVLMLVAVTMAMEVRSAVDDATASTQRTMHDLYADHRPPVPEEKTAAPEAMKAWRRWRQVSDDLGMPITMSRGASQALEERLARASDEKEKSR